MKSSDLQRLMHIRRYCMDIEELMERFGKEFAVFISDRAYYYAVTMCLLQIGELSGGLSEEFRRATAAQIPWAAIKGMRNWVAHQYAELDERTTWDTATKDIPALKAFCDRALSEA